MPRHSDVSAALAEGSRKPGQLTPNKAETRGKPGEITPKLGEKPGKPGDTTPYLAERPGEPGGTTPNLDERPGKPGQPTQLLSAESERAVWSPGAVTDTVTADSTAQLLQAAAELATSPQVTATMGEEERERDREDLTARPTLSGSRMSARRLAELERLVRMLQGSARHLLDIINVC